MKYNRRLRIREHGPCSPGVFLTWSGPLFREIDISIHISLYRCTRTESPPVRMSPCHRIEVGAIQPGNIRAYYTGCNCINMITYCTIWLKFPLNGYYLIRIQAFSEFQVSPALITNFNAQKSIELSNVKCKILTYFWCGHYFFYLIWYPERCLWKKNEKFIWLSFWDIAAPC